MSDGEEWGEWVCHDGKHMPPHGSICRATFDDCTTLTGVVDHDDQSHRDAFLWLLPEDEAAHVIRYRIRKPRGLTILENLIADLPAPIAPKVTA